MKAKMEPGEKPTEAGGYLCIWCDTTFAFAKGKLECPNCKNANPADLVVIYVEEDATEERMYCQVDYQGG